jgi:hypothetical protein
MKKIAILLTALLSLAGCGNEDASTSQSATKAASNNTLTLSDGEKISLSGELVKTLAKPNAKGALKLHEIKFDSGAKVAENTVFHKFSKLGYTRKVIENSDKAFKVHYYKPGLPVVGSIYQEQTTAAGQTSQLSLYWQSI